MSSFCCVVATCVGVGYCHSWRLWGAKACRLRGKGLGKGLDSWGSLVPVNRGCRAMTGFTLVPVTIRVLVVRRRVVSTDETDSPK